MNRLQIEIKNCYGINQMKEELDFSNNKQTQIIYAPNGVMKTSFANIFDDFSKEVESKDRLFPNRDSKRILLDENGVEIVNESVFVVRPYDKEFKSDKVSTLLVKDELRVAYQNIHAKIDDYKKNLFEQLKKSSGVKKEIEKEICDTFKIEPKDIMDLLEQKKSEILSCNFNFEGLDYKKVFDENVMKFIMSDGVQQNIKEYISKYDELISDSKFLRKEFNHYNASTIQKSLKDNGFFKAAHTVNLMIDGEKTEIRNEKMLQEIIEDEKQRILSNHDLKTVFDKIDKKISNAKLRDFRNYLFENQELLTELSDIHEFKKKVWVYYLFHNINFYNSLIAEYSNAKKDIKRILDAAREEVTEWEKVIKIFNSRFHVPYKLNIKNKADTILNDEAPSVEYLIGSSEEVVEESLLIDTLSQGEKRALYLLNIIFEIESRKQQGLETLFIIDDIADSFDYKNKYAIIEYLKDIFDNNIFYSIILTHNFDFYRTIQDRISSGKTKHEASFMAVKDQDGIRLEQLKYKHYSNPLISWKKSLLKSDTDFCKFIASITFVRNITEYTGDKDSYNKLTGLLHVKKYSSEICVRDVEDIYKKVFIDLEGINLDKPDLRVLDLIFNEAEKIIQQEVEEGLYLENKIVLSIAIRLKAELFMISKINDNDFVDGITKYQTFNLIKEYKKRFPNEMDSIEVLEKVNIMTPENIHLNSFMFEPIIDLSDHHLKNLYRKLIEMNYLLAV
ncbi:hypothetical protein NST67_14995 [Bacillus sp. FSL W7-1321]